MSRYARGRGRGMAFNWQANQRMSASSAPGLQNSAALGQTLHFITKIKLQELEKQRLAFEAHAKVLEEANSTTDLTQRVELLLKAVRDWSGSGGFKDPTAKQIVGGKLDLEHLDLWLRQSKKDPCFSPSIIRHWGDTLEAHIRHNLSRFKYAHLFGSLLTEWTASGDSVTGLLDVEVPESSTSSTPTSQEEFVDMGRKEMVEQMEQLQEIIFKPAAIDVPAYHSYLDGLFSTDIGKEVLTSVRDQIKAASVQLQHERITAADMSWTIQSALSSDLMNEAKRATLKEMAASTIVLEELASVLTMRLADLESWTWPADGILVDMRRALNGKYRAFTDPDILDGLFLEYIGVKWQITFKSAFQSVFSSKLWKPSIPFIPRKELEHRRQFINASEETFRCSLESSRVENRKNHFFMSQLTNSTGRRHYDDGKGEESGNETLQAIQIKQRLIHVMMTDCLLNTALHKTHTVVRSDFEWFGPSLPHDSMLATLEYFGVSKSWLKLFKSFLRAPIRFQQDPSGVVRVRERGTPVNYSISQLLGEVLLFGMDLAVNQRANGLYLYRLHDDLWLWDPDQERCEAAWAEMSKFASITGLKFNEKKTGAARVGGELSAKLPRGDVRWGFLKFDVEQARFTIDQEDVTPHIVELKRQLAATKSVFGWVNVFNRYMAFFRRNFGGRPPACFGQPLINDIIDTFARIQRELFPNHVGGAIGYLQALIKTRFGVDNIPEGYFYFPITQGGLELRNPMIEAYALQKSDRATDRPNGREDSDDDLLPTQLFVKQMEEKDKQHYRDHQENWDSGRTTKTFQLGAPDEFMSFDEYVKHRETLLEHWQELWLEMLRVPDPRDITLPPVLQALQTGSGNDYYAHYVLALYGEELVRMFGSLELVDANLIPVGMVDLFKTSKLKWDQ
ncbi:hypothetical protein CCMSSC00406_0009842 [Pleurotus cornucopiae]|uniref:Uncharacterized protein n=1 Tax=Pleurotus cornucopiae TaxID=5321 RepID=A0ACB7IT45_PLECO|nr:hypothetical protein CCMSSC00406_0009842 [Pleurotus cornucopiae]